MSERGRPTRLGELVEAFLEEKGLEEQIRRQTVLEAWPAAVGEGIARVSRATKIEDATLFVEVRSSAWLMELEIRKGDLLRRLNEGREDGRIDKIVFLMGGGGDTP